MTKNQRDMQRIRESFRRAMRYTPEAQAQRNFDVVRSDGKIVSVYIPTKEEDE